MQKPLVRFELRRVACIALLACSAALATPLPDVACQEVEALLQALQHSGCRFNRSGVWYTGAQARAHLRDKLQQLERRMLMRSTQDFIDLAASTSSISGKPYLVQCEAAQPVESKVWLLECLKALRMPG
jgi:Family of unknown function (DUF5329)